MEDPREKMKKWIWRLIYPSLTYSGIMYAVGMIALAFFLADELGMMDFATLLDNWDSLVYRAAEEYYSNSVLLQGIAALVSLPVMLLFLRWSKVRRAEANIVEQPADHAPVWMALILVFGAITSYAGNGMVTLSGLGQVDEEFDQIAELIYQGNLGLELICLGVLVPIVEELIFRGLMYTQMTEYVKKSRAVIITSVLFGFFHGNLLQAIYATALSLLMIYVYERFHTLAAPILFHIGANVFGILMTETELFHFLFSTDAVFFTSVIVSSLLIIGVVWLVERRSQRCQIVENSEV